MGDDFKLRAAEEMSKEIRDRLNKHYSTKDKEAVDEFIERKREESDRESKRLETETKSAIDELKSTITRAGRNIKVEVMDAFSEKLNFKNCLCCNQPTLRTELHDICDNCNWQDDPAAWNDQDDDENANGISLRQARINYEKTGNCDGINKERQLQGNKVEANPLDYGVTDEQVEREIEYYNSNHTEELVRNEIELTKKTIFHITELERLVKNKVDVHLRVGERTLRIARDLLQLSLSNPRTELTEVEAKLVEKRYDEL